MGVKKYTPQKRTRKTESHNYYSIFEIGRHLGASEDMIHRVLDTKGIKGLSNIPELQPFIHLFVEFKRKKDSVKKAYGIKKCYWDHYIEYGKIPQRMGPKPVDPLDPDSYQIKCLRFNAPSFYGRFKAGLVRANKNSLKRITLEDAVWMAIQEFMDRRPEYFYPEKVGVDDGRQTEIRS